MAPKYLAKWWLLVSAGAACLAPLPALRADETEAQKLERISKMTGEEKIELLGKQQRYLDLSAEGKKKLDDLYEAVSSDPNAKHLEATIRRYNQWLANLSSGQRAAVLSIADPKERIVKIKELITQQEEQRFRNFAQGEISSEDRELIYAWLGDFVLQHDALLRERMPPDAVRRLDEADESGRRRQLIASWWQQQAWRREVPLPSSADYEQLLVKLSAETRKQIEAKPEERMRRIGELVRAAAASRMFSPPSRDELNKFYTSMKQDDPRREKLEGLEGEDLHRELNRMYGEERFGRRGGGPRGGGRGGGFGGQGGNPGRGGPPEFRDGPGPGPGRGDGPGRGEGPPRGKGGPGKGDGPGPDGRGDGKAPPPPPPEKSGDQP